MVKEEEEPAVEEGSESRKRKAEAAAEGGAAKEAKKEDDDAKLEITKEEEEEGDEVPDNRKKITTVVGFEPNDMTLNVIPTTGGRVLMALSDCGLQYLVACARANVGVTAGRYFYEVRILEVLTPTDGTRRPQTPKQQVRIGFSVAGSSLFLGDSEESVCFDADGFYIAEKKKNATSQRYARDQIMGVLVNLDEKSPSPFTVSLFRDGERICDPQPLPEAMRGKTLSPHVSFRNVSLQVHFGPEPFVPLPRRCRMIQAAAQDDAVATEPPPAKGGKYNVVFPVGVPDEGTFDWLETFLERNPHYVELSDRKIVEWAGKSGLWKLKQSAWKNSNDKPDCNFGVQALDDLSARKVLQAVSPLVPRNYVVMEVKSNLVKSERMDLASRFNAPHFRRIARVVMGEPNEEYKERIYAVLLKEKQEKLDAEWKVKKAERERKRQLELRKEQLKKVREAAEEAKRKAAEEQEAKKKKKAEEAAAAGEKPEGEADAPAVEGKEEAKEEAAKTADEAAAEADAEMGDAEEKETSKEDEAEVKQPEEPEMEEPPKAELTEAEKKQWFKAQALSDLTGPTLASSFVHFSVPETDEGFSEIQYEWQGEEESKAYLRKWVLQKKLTTRVEDLQPSDRFFTRLQEWQKVLQEWQMKQKEYKADPVRRLAAQKAKEVQEKREAEAAAGAEGKEEGEGEQEKEEPQEPAVPETDIFSIEDVSDVGSGEPLFANFAFEDWALMSLRFEVHLLIRSFKADVNDPDRPGMHESHFGFYYNKYYRKQLNTKFYGVDTTAELMHLIKDTASVHASTSIVVSKLPEDSDPPNDHFVKLAEENRRERQRRLDAGDETAKLKFSVLAAAPTPAVQQPLGGPQRVAPPGVRGFPGAPAWATGPQSGIGRPAWR
eukprot:CAMPEP_0170587024 /NCGR_PEP_ID=MMETSP0224-20130122/10062_1 /TAXON_ID=285029 /ORGANISM="Togula jolla, Strain CCCM 725" /LENGTH=887 /DNA_ID=CAMNT_0010910619 /DNA_START=32 /DNA_END=2692 /DNA_ORIENTATION=-